MLSTTTRNAKNETYRELLNELQTGENREAVFREIREICENCQPSSPIMCMEFCPIWKLKRQLLDIEVPVEKPGLAELLNLAKNDRRLKILEVLVKGPCSLKELRDELKDKGHYHSLSLLLNHYVKPLLDADFIREENALFNITLRGKNMYNILTESEVANLPIHSKGYEERILKALLSGSRPREELTKIVPRGSLYRSLKRLQQRSLIVKSNLSGRTFYFAAKRRPTRKFSPTEMKIFKALPKEGISVTDLSEKTGISVRRVYKYLRRLRYKRHVKKGEKTALYGLTDNGRLLAQSLNAASSLIQS